VIEPEPIWSSWVATKTRETRHKYDCAYRLLGEWTLSKPLGEIRSSDIVEFANWLQKRRAPTTVTFYLDVLSSFFNAAVRDGILPKSPFHGLNLRCRIQARNLMPVDCDSIAKAVAGVGRRTRRTKLAARNAAMFRVLLYTGARPAEIVNLRTSDVDLASGDIVLDAAGSPRRVGLPTFFLPELTLYATTLRKLLPASPYLFPSASGARLDVGAVNGIARANGIRVADLRTAFALNLLEQGATLSQLHALLGNRSVSATCRYIRAFQEPMSVNEFLESKAPVAAAD